MDMIDDLKFRYEEWMLKRDSPPGWELVLNFIKTIIEMEMPFHGWIFELNPVDNVYEYIEQFDYKKKNSLLNSIRELIRKDSICIIRYPEKESTDLLLKDYSKTAEGEIKNTQESEVFPVPINLTDTKLLSAEGYFLVIYHDGEPLFTLKPNQLTE